MGLMQAFRRLFFRGLRVVATQQHTWNRGPGRVVPIYGRQPVKFKNTRQGRRYALREANKGVRHG